MFKKCTVAVIGAGNVGIAAAYSIFTQDIASEIIIIDRDEEKARGEAMDLMHGQVMVEPVDVKAGKYSDLTDSQVIIISAGTGRREGESRLDLMNRNVEILRHIISEVDKYAPEAILVIATNPVDIITYVIQKLTVRQKNHVIGTGTMLDTARFRSLLGQYYGVAPHSVHAYILGEHGDTEVPIWSNATIGGLNILKNTILNKPFNQKDMDNLFYQVKTAGAEVIKRKGYTSTAIGLVIAKLVETILDDEKGVLPVSVYLDGEYGIKDVCLSIPCVLGLKGIEGRILPELTEEEILLLKNSAETLRKNIEGLKI